MNLPARDLTSGYSPKRCCERDRDSDGNCDRHPRPPPPVVSDRDEAAHNLKRDATEPPRKGALSDFVERVVIPVAPPREGPQLWEQVRDLQLALNSEREAGRLERIGVGELHQWFDFAKDIIRSCAQSRDYENADDFGAADWWEHQRRCREFMLKIEDAP